MNPTAENHNAEANQDDGSCIVYGCTLSVFPNYNSAATEGDGSCDMSSTDIFGCTDSLAFTFNINANIDNGTCRYDPIVGDLAKGGIVFYIDETGQHGLVAALEDLGSFEWGCRGTTIYSSFVTGCTDINAVNYNPFAEKPAHNEKWWKYSPCVYASCDDIPDSIGCVYTDGYSEFHGDLFDYTCSEWGGSPCRNDNFIEVMDDGYQNTIDIVNVQCSSEYGGITAAQAALDVEINGYDDWYLPSKGELRVMYNTIGNGGPLGNIGGFENTGYWSSSEAGLDAAWNVYLGSGSSSTGWKNYLSKVRHIRAF